MSAKSTILVSACLLGENCRYDGKTKRSTQLLNMIRDYNIISVCPEVEGGLSTPRPPAEIVGNQVLRGNGEDVSAQFHGGANSCTQTALEHDASLAILKSRSPACGCGEVYDGSFSGNLVNGDGIFTQSLKATGIMCISDEDYLK